jgi:hypothetical protein
LSGIVFIAVHTGLIMPNRDVGKATVLD